MRRMMIATVMGALALSAALPATALAASCRDDKGKFIKCPAPLKPAKCRDAKGKFIKCPAPK